MLSVEEAALVRVKPNLPEAEAAFNAVNRPRLHKESCTKRIKIRILHTVPEMRIFNMKPYSVAGGSDELSLGVKNLIKHPDSGFIAGDY